MFIGVLLIGWVPRAPLAQSLADVAKKTAEERDARKDRAKVITNADLKSDDALVPPIGDLDPSTPTSPPIPLTESDRTAIIRDMAPSVVTIETSVGTGSGFFVAPGVVLTNRHVIDGGSSIRVRFSNGRTTSAFVSSTATDADLALVRVDSAPATLKPVTLGSLKNVQVGQDVLVVGSALGVLQNTVTRGIVSAVRTVGGLTYVQTDAAINPGNSGGPLIVGGGQVIAIATARLAPGESLGFAIAIDHARSLIQGQTSVARRESSAASNLDDRLETVFKSPGKSDTDVARERGTQQFETAVKALAQTAGAIDVQWQRYRSCAGKGTSGAASARDWFGIWADRASAGGDATPECRALFDYVVSLSGQINAAMQQATEDARRADVYPGTRRDIRRKYQMDWSGWDR